MRPVLTASEMRAADRATIDAHGVPGAVLRERAGAAVAALVRERHPGARVAVLCGRGNNGGDGFVVARLLGAPAWLLGSREGVTGDARAHLDALLAGGGRVTDVADEAAWDAVRAEALADGVIVDALLGTGLRAQPTGLVARVIADVARLPPSRVVAVDVPSGVPSDAGVLPWPAVRAGLTVTFGALKHGLVMPPACDHAGEVVVADIGIPAEALGAPSVFLLEAGDAAFAWAPRERDAHKGRFGHVLVVAGSTGKSGAAALAGIAALRAGAGLVTVATPEPLLPLVAAARPELMTEPLPHEGGAIAESALARALELAGSRDAVVLGPGLGTAPGTIAFVRALVRDCPVPLVVDADGLNALAGHDASLARTDRPVVLTPHPGEMARLAAATIADVQRDRLAAARALAARTGAVVVLKGHGTLVTRGDGRTAVNPTGNPGMATGGTGDVLAGMTGALLARGGDPWRAACAAVYVHGLAGDIASRDLGEEGLLAGDVIEAIREAVQSVVAARG